MRNDKGISEDSSQETGQTMEDLRSENLSNDDVLLRLTEYLVSHIAPKAEEIDQHPTMLSEALRGMGDRQLLALRVPREYGGAGCNQAQYYEATVKITAASGILAFLQTQHQSAAMHIYRYGGDRLRSLLPEMARGKRLIGVGFSHLRRSGTPQLRAMPDGSGFCLTGKIPWITGYGYFQQAIAGATLPNGDELYALIPLKNSRQAKGGCIDCGEPLPLAAMGGSRTVAVTLQSWLIAPEEMLVIKPAGSIHAGDRQNVLHHGFYALGCAQGALQLCQRLQTSEQAYLVWQLQQHLQQFQQRMFAALEIADTQFETLLALRVEAIALAQQYAQAALALAGGAGNLLSHPAQRIYREALMFSVFGQTAAIRNATLQALIPSESSRYTNECALRV